MVVIIHQLCFGSNNPASRKEVKNKISLSLKGIKKSLDHCRNMSLAQAGKTRSEEQRKNMSLVRKGKPWSDKRRQNFIKKNNR